MKCSNCDKEYHLPPHFFKYDPQALKLNDLKYNIMCFCSKACDTQYNAEMREMRDYLDNLRSIYGAEQANEMVRNEFRQLNNNSGRIGLKQNRHAYCDADGQALQEGHQGQDPTVGDHR